MQGCRNLPVSGGAEAKSHMKSRPGRALSPCSQATKFIWLEFDSFRRFSVFRPALSGSKTEETPFRLGTNCASWISSKCLYKRRRSL